MNIIKKGIFLLGVLVMSMLHSHAVTPTQTDVLSFTISSFTRIAPVTSPVLTACITDRTGNLHAPMHARFKVITNSSTKKTLYLNAKTVTEGGYEDAMFTQGGQVYIAFANLAKVPASSALNNCKRSAIPADSPGVVAYPIISVSGAENKFLPDINRYELSVPNGTTMIDVNVGANVLRNSFASNDRRGFYQAVLSLTETDI